LYINIIKKDSFVSYISFSRVKLLKDDGKKLKIIFFNILKILKYIVFILVIISLARSQKGRAFERSTDKGIDIMIALDTSTSMRSLDFKPLNRIESAKSY
jgi:Ca-activated chloride channel family protein